MNLKDLTIGVIGAGTVGCATARAYIEHVKDVRVWDIDPLKHLAPLDTTLNSDLVFICLPEGAVPDFFRDLSKSWQHTNFIIKSTVPIGTTRRLATTYNLTNLVHSPEFLTERCAITDAYLPSRNIIGTPIWKGIAHNSKCTTLLEDLYIQRFTGVPTLLMSSDESELAKLATNAFFAVKISFFNEIRELSDAANLNWHTVLKGILSDGRISHSHTQVPGPDGQRGFGGKCLPKDLVQLGKHAAAENTPLGTMFGAALTNERLRGDNTTNPITMHRGV